MNDNGGKKMKKVLILTLCCVLAASLVFAGCAARDTGEDIPADTADEPAGEASEGTGSYTAGGWTLNPDSPSILTDEQKEIFDAALNGIVGADFTPVAVLSTQVVAGMNYQYLCMVEPVVKDPVPGWEIVNVYVNTRDVCELISINDLDLADPELTDADSSDIVGGWECAIEGSALSGDAASAFAKTSGEYEGIKLTPAVLLGTQVVAGTNYRLVCRGEKNGKAFACVATVYADLDGNAEITDCGVIDAGSYYEDKSLAE